MLLERKAGRRTSLWVGERRGRCLWFRRGFAGNKGRVSNRECDDEAAAERLLEVEARRHLADGYHLVSRTHGVDAPFQAAVLQAPHEPRVTTRQLAARVDALCPPLQLGALVEASCAALGVPADERLTGLSLELKQGSDAAALAATFSTGAGGNPDDFEHTTLSWRLRLAEPWGDADDGVALDAFSDEVRAGPTLAARFQRGFVQLRTAARLACLIVTGVERSG